MTMVARAIVLLAVAAERTHGANADERRDHLNNATIQIDTKPRKRFKCGSLPRARGVIRRIDLTVLRSLPT